MRVFKPNLSYQEEAPRYYKQPSHQAGKNQRNRNLFHDRGSVIRMANILKRAGRYQPEPLCRKRRVKHLVDLSLPQSNHDVEQEANPLDAGLLQTR